MGVQLAEVQTRRRSDKDAVLPAEPSVVGERVLRLDGREKVTGKAVYLPDFSLPKMLYGKILRSPHAHAEIVSIDARAALALPDVKAVISAADLPDRRHGPLVLDRPVLARGKVVFVGEPVAAVAALTLEAAEQGLRLINVEYRRLPEVLDPEAALEDDAPLVHDDLEQFVALFPIVRGGNVCSKTTVEAGDVEKAFAESDHVYQHAFRTPMVHQTHLEPNGAVASVDADGNITCWTTTQCIHDTQIFISEALDVPMSSVRVIQTCVGGGFGAKAVPSIQPIVVALAMKTGRPVKLVLTRQEDMTAMTPRHASVVTVKTGVKSDGTIVGRQIRLIYDTGAWAGDGPGVAGFGALIAAGPYRLDNYRIESYCVYTNKVPAGAMRGFGNPQAAWAGESQLDIIAESLGIDPLEMRVKNAVDVDSRTVGGQKLSSVGLKECLARVRERIDWEGPRAKNHGRGVACMHHHSAMLMSSAHIRLNQDGTIHVAVGAADLGQGSTTILAQIAAEELGLPLEDIRIVTQDTDATPYNWATAGTRTTSMAGTSVQGAAADVRRQILALAAQVLEVPAEQLCVGGGWVLDHVSGERRLSFADIGRASLWQKGGPILGRHSWTFEEQPWGTDVKVEGSPHAPHGFLGRWIYGAQAVELEVDPETGVVHILKAVAAHDVGRAINPTLVEGQIQGGMTQGIGYALFEELQHEDGIVICDNLHDHKLPTSLDVPDIAVEIVESYEINGPFGAKGLGEAPLVATAPAIGNALYDAVGIRMNELPMNPEKVVNAIRRISK
jgi:CO/xanthine dehydrogenase Mo-binding subunit